MFESFPVISIYDQDKVINWSIRKYNLSCEDVLIWLDLYGNITIPVRDERLILDYDNLDEFAFVSVENQYHMFAYYSKFGFVNGISIDTVKNQLTVFQRGWL